MSLKVNIKSDEQYMVNLTEISSPKNEIISVNYENSIIVNRIACGDARD